MSLNKKELRFAIVSTDIVLLRKREGGIEYAIQTVHRAPHYDNVPGVIGGVLKPDETSLGAATRILREKTNISKLPYLRPLGFYDEINRDLRGRVVSLAYVGIVEESVSLENVLWLSLHTKKKLAYDHNLMLEDAKKYIKDHMFLSTIMLHFMEEEFVVSDFKKLFEGLLGEELDKRNFYKFLERLPMKFTDKMKSSGRGRPAQICKKTKETSSFFL